MLRTASHSLLHLALPGLLACLLALTSCGGSSANTTPDAHTLITQAQAAIQKVTSYHFNLAVDHPGTGGLLDPRTLSDSNTGVSAILGHIQNPSTPADSSVDGTSCWSINGTLDATYLAAITGGGAPAGSIVKVTTCIGKSDHLPYLIKMSGVAAQGDTANTVRTFKLSKFDESLTITAPIP